MRIISPLMTITTTVIFLVALIFVGIMVFDVVSVCDNKNLQTKEIIVVNKFVVNKGLNGDHFYFLDEEGIDYKIWGGHEGARYIKMKLNQTYQINVNVEFGNVSCKEILIKGGDKDD